MKKILLISFLLPLLTSNAFSQTEPQLTVHEWGTTTSVHYSNGFPVGRLNAIRPEEVLPDFVHRLDEKSLKARPLGKAVRSSTFKGHPDVIMRLETPVIYFYPSESFDLSQRINVDVQFHGGLLNEYYPDAIATYQRLDMDQDDNTNLAKDTVSRLYWRSLWLSREGTVPETDSKVWLAPREVNSAFVNTNGRETEKYLFYRGVANLPSLLKTTYDDQTQTLDFFKFTNLELLQDKVLNIPAMWVMNVKEDGRAAFKQLDPFILPAQSEGSLMSVAIDFTEEQYSEENLNLLKGSIHTALVKDGLFPEEAAAMLNTWEDSYFYRKGTRILYIVPKEWTNAYLPIQFSIPVNLERVIIGRIDLEI